MISLAARCARGQYTGCIAAADSGNSWADGTTEFLAHGGGLTGSPMIYTYVLRIGNPWTLHQNPKNWVSGDPDGYSLGTSDGTVDPSTTSLNFTGGDICSGGVGRVARVTLSGGDTLSLAATETSRCVYALRLALPGCRAAESGDSTAPQMNCTAGPIRVPSSTLELSLGGLFTGLADDDASREANIAVAVRTLAGDAVASASVQPNAGAASVNASWDACDSSNYIEGIRLTDWGRLGGGDSPALAQGGGYQNNIDCYWRLSCSDPDDSPVLSFTSFSTERQYDFVYLRDGPSHNGTDNLVAPQHGWVEQPDFDHVGSAQLAWVEYHGKYLPGCTSDVCRPYEHRDSAEDACEQLRNGCGGITHIPSPNTVCGNMDSCWQTRSGSQPALSPTAESSWGKAMQVQASGPDMAVHFHTDSSVTSSGFQATFACAGATTDTRPRNVRSRRYNDDAESLTFRGRYERYDGVDCTNKRSDATIAGPALTSALDACDTDPSCLAVQDHECDGVDLAVCVSGSTYESASDSARSCVYEREPFRAVTIGPLEGLPPLQDTAVQITATDRAGNDADCGAIITVISPHLLLSRSRIDASGLITSIVIETLTLTNEGTDDLLLHGMTVQDSDGNDVAWMTAKLNDDNGDVQIAGTDDIQLLLAPQQTSTVSIELNGAAVPEQGNHTGYLRISSNDPADAERTVPLHFNVNDFGSIMVGLPQTIAVSVVPDSASHHSQLVYNVYAGSLDWAFQASGSNGCICSTDSQAHCGFECQLLPAVPDDVLIFVESCNGTIPQAEYHRVNLCVEAPRTAGRYSRSWNLEPIGLNSRSFLRTNMDIQVTPSVAEFQPNLTSVRAFEDDISAPLRASHNFKLACIVYDAYHNEIRSDGLREWSLVLTDSVNATSIEPLVFDFGLASGGQEGAYSTGNIMAKQQGTYAVGEMASDSGERIALLHRFVLRALPLQCDPPRIRASSDGASCLVQRCDPGHEPSSDRSRCVPCERGSFSADGVRCTLCANGTAAAQTGSLSCSGCKTGSVSNIQKTGCDPCPPGTEPNGNHDSCTACAVGNYSQFGSSCQICSAPNVVDAARTMCYACPAGAGPNGGRTDCVACPEHFYSIFGNCLECIEPNRVSADRATCLPPTQCRAGYECPSNATCIDESNCTACGPGKKSLRGGPCELCDDPGKVANRQQNYCESCAYGKAPVMDRSECQPCAGATYSSQGVECSECPEPRVVDAERIRCELCEPGKGPTQDRTGCIACETGNYSAIGRCQRCSSVERPNANQSACESCPAGKVASGDGSACTACPMGTVRAQSAAACAPCPAGKISNAGQSDCEVCEKGSVPSEDRMSCVCESGYYNTRVFPKVDCFDNSFVDTAVPYSNKANCTACPHCMTCESDTVTIDEGYQTASWDIASATVDRRVYAFKCAVAAACLAHNLTEAGSEPTATSSCKDGHNESTPLCFGCDSDHRKGPKGTCTFCDEVERPHLLFLNPLFLIPVGLVLAYVAFRQVLSHRRQTRLNRVVQAESLFEEIDLDGDGKINREDLRKALNFLSHDEAEAEAREADEKAKEADRETARRILEQIDMKSKEAISAEKEEFVMWMQRNVSQVKMGFIVVKILFGLTQVLSRQPETVKEDFPGPHWEEFKLFSFDFSWMTPVCGVDYWTRWGFNALLLPLLLTGLVWLTWKTERCDLIGCARNRRCRRERQTEARKRGPSVSEAAQKGRISVLVSEADESTRTGGAHDADTLDKAEVSKTLKNLFGTEPEKERLEAIMQQLDQDGDGVTTTKRLKEWLNVHENDDVHDERKASKESDYYFAFFLAYPTMTQTFFSHFNCRKLATDLEVLEADYSIECGGADGKLVWWFSLLGIVFVSCGFPLYQFWRMHKFMSTSREDAKALKRPLVHVYGEFHKRFGYMSGDFRPEAYYAECVDLFRKMCMTGALVLLAPGTVIQSFCSVLMAMFFLAVQIKLWPYPHRAANMLKAFTDLQIFLVSLVGLVLRINPAELQNDPLSKGFILCALEQEPCGDAGNRTSNVEQTSAASFYGDVLLLLLVLTLIPVILSLWKHSDVQQAQRFLLEAGHIVDQDPGMFDVCCCRRQRKKKEEFLRRRAKLRKMGTVAFIRFEPRADLSLNDEHELGDFRLAVKRACEDALKSSKTVKTVKLSDHFAKVYFEAMTHKESAEELIAARQLQVEWKQSFLTAVPADWADRDLEQMQKEHQRVSFSAAKTLPRISEGELEDEERPSIEQLSGSEPEPEPGPGPEPEPGPGPGPG